MGRLRLLLCVIVIVDTAFYAVVAPLLPGLSDELGLSKAQAGVLVGAYPAGTLLGALPSGLLAARVGPRATVICGLALLAGSSLVFGFARELLLLDCARFVQGVGGACCWAGAFAWLLAGAPADRRGELIGTLLAAGIAGTLLGPVLGGVAAGLGERPVFGGVALLAAVLALVAARRPRPVTGGGASGLRDVARVVRRPGVVPAMWLVALPALAFGCLGTLVPLRLDDLGASHAAVAAAFLVAAGVEACVSPIVGRLSDRRGRLVPIRGGLAVSIVLLGLVLLPSSALLLAVVLVAVFAALGTFWAPSMAMLSDAAETHGLAQGQAFALVNLAWAAGQTAGSAAGGAFAQLVADAAPLLVVAFLCALTLARLSHIVTSPVGGVQPATGSA